MQLLSPVASNTTSKPTSLELERGQIGCLCDGQPEMARGEIEAIAIVVGDHPIHPCDAGKERCAQTDRAGADYKGSLPRRDKRPPDSLGADGEEFDRGRLGERQPFRGIEIGGGDDDALA